MRWLVAAVVRGVMVASLASVTGCESVFGIGDLPFPADGSAGDSSSAPDTGPQADAGMDTRPPVDSGPPKEAGPEAGPICTPTLPYVPVTWKPPTVFMEPACTATQLGAYETCFPSCDNFRQDPANAACVSCIETDEGAVAHGPVITTSKSGSVTPIQVNIGGCQAQLDGNSVPGCCGNQENDSRGCLSTECGTCSDFADPAPGGPAQTCEQMAGAGTCSGYVPQPTCDAELDGGVASQCLTLSTFLPLWCAPPGPPPTCYSNTAFTPPAWQPPSAFGQAACSDSQIAAYLECFPSCSAFDAANPTCAACIETDVNGVEFGPIITSAGTPIEVNFGGCEANLDGDKGAGSCGDQIDSFNACASQECGTCPDFANPQQGGMSQQCEANAFNDGVCTAYNESPTCDAELVDGGVAAQCGNLATFVGLWCAGSSPADGGPSDGAGAPDSD